MSTQSHSNHPGSYKFTPPHCPKIYFVVLKQDLVDEEPIEVDTHEDYAEALIRAQHIWEDCIEQEDEHASIVPGKAWRPAVTDPAVVWGRIDVGGKVQVVVKMLCDMVFRRSEVREQVAPEGGADDAEEVQAQDQQSLDGEDDDSVGRKAGGTWRRFPMG